MTRAKSRLIPAGRSWLTPVMPWPKTWNTTDPTPIVSCKNRLFDRCLPISTSRVFTHHQPVRGGGFPHIGRSILIGRRGGATRQRVPFEALQAPPGDPLRGHTQSLSSEPRTPGRVELERVAGGEAAVAQDWLPDVEPPLQLGFAFPYSATGLPASRNGAPR
jgi:hypothetical protein